MNLFRNHRDRIAFPTGLVRRKEPMMAGVFMSSMACLCWPMAAVWATDNSSPMTQASQAQDQHHFFIGEYQVEGGGHLLPKLEVEAAVYPYLGPYRTTADVEQARGALEQAYRDKGYQTVTVQIPPQHLNEKGGVVILEVSQGEVGRLRVHGSRYFSIDQIKREAPSLQEGQSPDFSQVSRDLQVLNNISDRRVTPTLRIGETPGTVDVDLTVKDTFPMHGSLEINNRYSTDTTPLRINGSVDYDNLWQLEHSIGFSFQVAPENPNEVQVFTGYYLARIPDVSGISFMLSGTKQDSNVNTLGGIGVSGPGDTIGGSVVFTLPALTNYYHSVTLGVSYKDTNQILTPEETEAANALNFHFAPVTYYPFNAAYSGSWVNKDNETDINASINLSLGEFGSSPNEFEISRHGSDGDYIYLRGDLSHTHDLPEGFQIFAKVQGQAASEPLISNEQFSGGGIGTVRGLLESEVLGDNGLLGSVELRTPSISSLLGKAVNEWRFYIFSDGGVLTLDKPLIETPYQYNLLSTGAGTRFKVLDHINGSLDLGIPLIVDALEYEVPPGQFVASPIREHPYDAQLTFRVWADF